MPKFLITVETGDYFRYVAECRDAEEARERGEVDWKENFQYRDLRPVITVEAYHKGEHEFFWNAWNERGSELAAVNDELAKLKRELGDAPKARDIAIATVRRQEDELATLRADNKKLRTSLATAWAAFLEALTEEDWLLLQEASPELIEQLRTALHIWRRA